MSCGAVAAGFSTGRGRRTTRIRRGAPLDATALSFVDAAFSSARVFPPSSKFPTVPLW